MEKDHLVTRRDVVRGGSAAITLATASSSMGPALALDDGRLVATGVVFEDRSGAGQRRPGDPGIAGVMVSNGRDVAKTDSEGRYALPVDDETIIFVIKPTGYALPVERGTMLPRFYYIHQPKGTPAHLGLRYRGIEPSGPLPSSVDFALQKVDEPARFDVLMFTDPHAGKPARGRLHPRRRGEPADRHQSRLRDDHRRHHVRTICRFYAAYNRIVGHLGVPWHNCAAITT